MLLQDFFKTSLTTQLLAVCACLHDDWDSQTFSVWSAHSAACLGCRGKSALPELPNLKLCCRHPVKLLPRLAPAWQWQDHFWRALPLSWSAQVCLDPCPRSPPCLDYPAQAPLSWILQSSQCPEQKQLVKWYGLLQLMEKNLTYILVW